MTQVEAFRDFTLGENLDVRVLVVERDPDYADIIAILLGRDSLEVDVASSASEALEKLTADGYGLIFLSSKVNAMDEGSSLLQRIRQNSIVPIIALNDPNEEEPSLSLVLEGADYDLQKPFTPRRMRAAVTAVLRRSEIGSSENNEPVLPETLITGELSLSLGRLEVTINNKKINLSAREFSLLQFLMTNPDKAFTREELAARAWGWAKGGEMRAIDSTIKRLRSKIEEDSRNPQYILTERNIGYRFAS